MAGKRKVLIIAFDAAQRAPVHEALRNCALPALQSATESTLIGPSCWTVPCMGSVLTGLFPAEHGLRWPLVRSAAVAPTMANLVDRAGQKFELIAANEVYAPPLVSFADHQAEFVLRRRPRWQNRLRRVLSLDDHGARAVLETLRRRVADEAVPDLALIHIVESHHPYLAPPQGFAPGARLSYGFGQLAHSISTRAQVWEFAAHATPEAWENARKRYLDCIHYDARIVEQMIKAYHDAGILEDTLVIITADHGEHLGEHDLADHQASLYEPVVNVPCLLIGPDLPDTIPGQFQHNDLLHTACSYLNVPTDGYDPAWAPRDMLDPAHWELGHEHTFMEWTAWGADQLASLQRRNPGYDFAPLNRELLGVRTREWKYIRESTGTRLLLNLRDDPGELDNVIEQHPDTAAALEQKLAEWHETVSARSGDPSDPARDESDEALVEQRLESLGYL